MTTKSYEKEELTQKVMDLLVKASDFEKDEMSPESLLFKELAIESAETLEITFRIEQEFGISIGEGEFWNIANLIANQGMIVDGKFSEDAIKLIKDNVSITDEQIEKIKSPFEIYDYIKIQDLINYLAKKIKF
ncbi:phosphopantetheine-binding protein [Ruminiclostridium papyrosolvens DSM 2782]|uniref:Phosphopantetheine-binding protein n=1 Tax=Ruminiclostridium papyrosolvens DSM 2782 TaxID=588581 RepID=F1TDQ7_9FIRM|nr:phosphopantetheine-binding protein [Ruminiclostridium papyrosolvens]EGD47353.1 phosphopantetheine-binding protein [Ruminiclostridium papyrosolvens DSM 2782]WES34699.1 phosphopantetheine-binding protein [Ruminiclostridium papyrosolvens DSM 2782]